MERRISRTQEDAEGLTLHLGGKPAEVSEEEDSEDRSKWERLREDANIGRRLRGAAAYVSSLKQQSPDRDEEHREEKRTRHELRERRAKALDRDIELALSEEEDFEAHPAFSDEAEAAQLILYQALHDFATTYNLNCGETVAEIFRNNRGRDLADFREDFPEADLSSAPEAVDYMQQGTHHPSVIWAAYQNSEDNDTSLEGELLALHNELGVVPGGYRESAGEEMAEALREEIRRPGRERVTGSYPGGLQEEPTEVLVTDSDVEGTLMTKLYSGVMTEGERESLDVGEPGMISGMRGETSEDLEEVDPGLTERVEGESPGRAHPQGSEYSGPGTYSGGKI